MDVLVPGDLAVLIFVRVLEPLAELILANARIPAANLKSIDESVLVQIK